MRSTCVCVSLCVAACTHKAVSSGFTRLSVCYNHSLVDVPEGLEVFPQRGIVRVVGQPSDEDFGESRVFLERCWMHDFQGSVHVLMEKHWLAGARTRGTLKLGRKRLKMSPHQLDMDQKKKILQTSLYFEAASSSFRLKLGQPGDSCGSRCRRPGVTLVASEAAERE